MIVNTPPTLPAVDKLDSRLATYLRQTMDWASKQLRKTLNPEEAVDHVFLLSPAGKVYKVTVTDLGVLTTTLTAPGTS